MLTNPSWNSLHSRKDMFFNWKRINYNNHVYSHFMCSWKETIVSGTGTALTAQWGQGEVRSIHVLLLLCVQNCVSVFKKKKHKKQIYNQNPRSHCLFITNVWMCPVTFLWQHCVQRVFFFKNPILCAAFWKINRTWRRWKKCLCETQKNTIYPHAVSSRASRECTASVRRRHGELGVLIKIFYKSACAVHMQDNGLERGGVQRILKQLPTETNPRVNMRNHTMKECVPLYLDLQRRSSRLSVCPWKYSVGAFACIKWTYLYFRHEKSKEKTIRHCDGKTIGWMRG